MKLSKFFGLMIFKNYTKLFLHCNRRLPSKIDLKIMEESALFGSKKKIAFSNYFYQQRRSNILLREYFKAQYISRAAFIFSTVSSFLIPRIKVLKSLLFQKKYDMNQIVRMNYSSKYLTFSAGVKRLHPRLKNKKIEDILVRKQIYEISFFMKIKCFLMCIYHNVYDYSLMLHYINLNQSLSLINFNGKECFIEEGRNPTQILFLDFAKRHSIRLTVIYRGIPPISRYYFGFKVLTTNNISKKILSKYNSSVEIIRDASYLIGKNSIKNNFSKNQIGFLPDLGIGGLTKIEKKRLDTFLNSISENEKIKIIISLHPEEDKKAKDYYESTFRSQYITISEYDDFIQYLREVDILVGFSSTGLFQAVLARRPVILLDLFDEKPMENLKRASSGLMRYAKDKNSFINCYNYYYSLGEADLNKYHRLFLSNIGVYDPN